MRGIFCRARIRLKKIGTGSACLPPHDAGRATPRKSPPRQRQIQRSEIRFKEEIIMMKTEVATTRFASASEASSTARPSIGADRGQILTVGEVALELRCSKAHVYNMIAGKVAGVRALPAILMGRRKLVRRAALEHWMETNETAAQWC
jgi:excisionase family DNA binding protein